MEYHDQVASGSIKRVCASGCRGCPDKVGLTACASPQDTGHQQPNNWYLAMSEEQAAHHLLNVLEERGLNIDLDNILLGFEDEDTKGEAAAWVHEYLIEETLLTREELEL